MNYSEYNFVGCSESLTIMMVLNNLLGIEIDSKEELEGELFNIFDEKIEVILTNVLITEDFTVYQFAASISDIPCFFYIGELEPSKIIKVGSGPHATYLNENIKNALKVV